MRPDDQIKRRNFLLRVAKYGENFFPVRKSSDLVIQQYYRVQNAIIKDTKFGQKVALIILDDLKEYLLYIGDFVTNKSKLDAILELLDDPDIELYVAVESFEERSTSSSVASFDYKIIEIGKTRDEAEAVQDSTEEVADMIVEDNDVEIVEELEQQNSD